MDIDALGLDELDRSLLRAIIELYNGGPVGLDTLAAALGEEAVTLEDVCEPYLMQMGFLTRTPGRCATRLAWTHLGLELPAGWTRPAASRPCFKARESANKKNSYLSLTIILSKRRGAVRPAPAARDKGEVPMRAATTWQDYELIDATCGNRLERWGSALLVRPDPQVVWKSAEKKPPVAKGGRGVSPFGKGGRPVGVPPPPAGKMEDRLRGADPGGKPHRF